MVMFHSSVTNYQGVFQIAIAKPPTRSTAIHQALRFHRVPVAFYDTSRCSVDRTLVSSTDLKTIVCARKLKWAI